MSPSTLYMALGLFWLAVAVWAFVSGQSAFGVLAITAAVFNLGAVLIMRRRARNQG
jgi:hypothetical protein